MRPPSPPGYPVATGPEAAPASSEAAVLLTEPQQVEAAITALEKRVEEAIRKTEDGGPVDFPAIEAEAAMVCESIVTLPSADAKRIAERLPAIVGSLDAIAKILADRQPPPDAGRDSGVGSRRAAAAYASSHTRAKRGF